MLPPSNAVGLSLPNVLVTRTFVTTNKPATLPKIRASFGQRWKAGSVEWEAYASVSNNPMAQFRPTERHNHSELWILTNVTIKGSRAYYHTYVLSQTFALQEQERFSFFTTTHEKDGGLLALPGFFAGERSFTNRTGSGSSLYKASSPTSTPPPLLEATPSMTTPSTLQPLVPTKSMVSTALLAFVWTTNATFFTRL